MQCCFGLVKSVSGFLSEMVGGGPPHFVLGTGTAILVRVSRLVRHSLTSGCVAYVNVLS